MAEYTFQDIFQYADSAVNTYVLDGAASAAASLQDVSHTLLIIYMLLWGWAMIRGVIQEPVTDGVGRIIKISIITGLATSSALYASYVSNFLYDWPTAFSGVLQGSGAQDSAQLLDQILDKGNSLGAQAWEKADLMNLGSYLISTIVYAVTWVITAISAVLIISSKLGLALILALGPAFILTMLFETTREFFNKWLGMAVTAGLTIVLVTMAAALIFKVMDASFDGAQVLANANAGIPTMKSITQIVIYGIIGIFFILGVPTLASGLGGGVSTASASAAGWAFGKARSGATSSGKKALGELSGKNRSDRQGERMRRARNAEWAQENPKPSRRIKVPRAVANTTADVYRKIASRNSSIKKGN